MTPEQAQLVSRYLRADADRAANSDDRNLLREAAGIVESAAAKPQQQTQTQTVRVRIAVMVDAEGHWAAYGWGTGEKLGQSVAEMLGCVAEMMGDHDGVEHWIEADVPLPATQTIRGKVTP